MAYDVGDRVRCTGTWTDSDDAATDPANVFATVQDPSGNQNDYTYGVDAELVKSATGIYYFDKTVDEAGLWRYRFYSTGSGIAAQENAFTVRTQQVT